MIISFEKLKELVQLAKQDIYDITDNPCVYLHWTAGHYGMPFDDYHICIDNDGSIEITTDDLAEVLAHTWGRNSGSIGIALECCVGAKVFEDEGTFFANLGDEPPTDEQIKSLAKCIAIICRELGIPVDEEHVITHAEAADEDGYGLTGDDPDCRWDLAITADDDAWGAGGDIIRSLARETEV